MTSIVLALVTLSFSMRGDRARGWPVKTEVTLTSAKAKKTLTIEASEARKPVAVEVEPGRYAMTIAAPHHRPFNKTIEIEKDLSLPEIALAPVPAISGRVVERRKDVEIPLAGAQIQAGDRQLTTTNDQGLFRVELSEPPAEITISHTGQAPKTIPLFANLAAENELGTIELDRGVTLTVILDRRFDEPKTLNVSVWNKKTIATREVKPAEDEVPFSGLAPGIYQIVVKGSEPLEVTSEKAEVNTDDVEQRVTLSPFPLDGRILLGNEGLHTGGGIEIAGRAWHAEVKVDQEGRFGGTMWQQGKVTGWVSTPLTSQPLMEISPELGPGPSLWQIALKRRFIEGKILDAETKQPIPKATLEVDLVSGERRNTVSAAVDKDGAYSIPAMQNGRYDLRANAPDHMDARRVVVADEQYTGQILDFALEGGVEATATFAWPDGRPVASATVVSNDGKYHRTDEAGRVTIRLGPGSTRTLIALPREGSFAFADVAAGRKGTPGNVQVVVAPPAGGLKISLFDKKRAPVRIPLNVSWNNRLLPPAVLERLSTENAGGAALRLIRLPAGYYDVWMRGAPPARVSVTAGEESVELVGR